MASIFAPTCDVLHLPLVVATVQTEMIGAILPYNARTRLVSNQDGLQHSDHLGMSDLSLHWKSNKKKVHLIMFEASREMKKN